METEKNGALFAARHRARDVADAVAHRPFRLARSQRVSQCRLPPEWVAWLNARTERFGFRWLWP